MKIKVTVNFKIKNTLLFSFKLNFSQFQKKFKVQLKVAGRCHYHHATRAYKALRLRFY